MEEKRRQLTPEQDALEHIVACSDKPFLEKRYIDSFKGRGVFTHKAIEPSTFVVEYRGNIFCRKNTSPKKKCDNALNNYLFEFSWNGADWCIDASTEDKTLGRLVNDDHISPNCEMKTVVCEGKPHMCLFAVKEISPGEEITYNYGDSSYSWRSRESMDGSSSSYADFYAPSSTPRNERVEESEAASSSYNSGSDDDELPESHENDSFATASHLEFRDSSPADFDSSQGSSMLPPDDASCTQQQDEAAVSFDEISSDGDYKPSKAKRKAKRYYANRNYCYLCGADVIKIARHLFRKHADEDPEIAKAFKLPKKSLERRRILEKLRNMGNYKHNQEVLKNNSGELRLRRRVRTEVANAKTHAHCLYCKGMLKRQEMWRHVARCSSRPKSNSESGHKTKVLSEIALTESRFAKKLPHGVWKMLVAMKPDEITFKVQNDFLLIQLAQYLANKLRNNPKKHEYIRQKLREMGRLLIALHEKSIFSFEEAIKPENFYKVVEAVKDIAGFDEKRQSYNKPSLVLKLGHSLKKIGAIVLAGVQGNEMTKDTKTFMKLCAQEWSELVSCTALASLKGRRVKPSTIPFTRDVQVFYTYLETTAASAAESLKVQENPEAYSALSRVTLAQVSVLNKCAPEVSKMTLKTFQVRDDTTRVLSKHFIRINIPSRTSQDDAVLLTSGLVSAMTLLVSKREACDVHKDNPFFFAKPNSSSTSLYHPGNCIRGFSKLCRAQNPEHLRSVHLHKHIARVFQFLNLENDELCHLAKLLGHDIRADRDYYRLPEAAVELAKIAKLLLAMEKGSLERFKGNSLEEIEIEDELEPDVEQGNSENVDGEEDDEASDLSPQQSDAVEQQAVMEGQLTPEQDAVEHIKARRDKPFLEEKFIDAVKGRGVFTRESIEPSAFVVEYRGNIVRNKETRRKKRTDALNNYLFDFSWNGTSWRVDASKDDGSLGRLVSDDHISPNCEMKKVVFKGKPHLCLFAVKEISLGEEITYNYGDSSYPWRSTESSGQLKQTDPNAAAPSPEDESGEDSAGASSSDESCSDDEYVPQDEPSSDESYSDQQSQTIRKSPDPDSSKQQSPVQQHADDSCVEQENESDYSSDVSTSEEEPENPSRTKKQKNKNYCYVCGKPQTKIARHLFTHRGEDAEIAEVFALPLYSKQRKRLLVNLRNKGNYKYNQKVLKTKSGELKLKTRKPNMSIEEKIITFTHCLYCKGVYSRKAMWRHLKNCSSKKSMKSPTRRRSRVLTLIAAAESTDQEVSSDVTKLLTKVKKDEITSAVFDDSHIVQLAKAWCHMNDGKNKKQENITQRLRQMGRLLLTLRKKSINSFEDALKSENFSKLVDAVNELAGCNEETKSGSSKNLTTKLGYSLKKMGEINLARALKEDADEQTVHEADTFLKLCEKEWFPASPPKSQTSIPAVPFIHDAQLLYQCMYKTAASAVESLTMYESPPVYTALLRVTVAQVSVLNKNVGEVSKVTLKSFNERNEDELQEDATASQSQLEQFLSKHFVRINVKSNRGKKVALTLTPKMLNAITLLVSKRGSCGVHDKNPFLFARPVAIITSFYHGQSCISTYIARCSVKNAVDLRAACFRKHVVRVFHILSLANEELDQLSKLLGRDIRTDAEYYQTPEAAVDIAKILELPSALENGTLERFEGKSLQEIEIAGELEPDVEQDNPENSDAEEDNEGSESSLQISGCSSSKGSLSTTKKHSRFSKGRGRSKRQDSENEASDLNDEKKDEVTTERDGSSPPGLSSSNGCFTTTKKPSAFSRYFDTGGPVRGRGRPRKKRQESENEESARKDEVNTEKDGSSPPGLSSSNNCLTTAKKPSASSRYFDTGGPVRGRGRPRKKRQESENEKSAQKDEVNTEKDGSSPPPPGLSSSNGCLSTAKKPSVSSGYFSTGGPVRGRGRPKKERQESENEESARNDEASPEKDDGSEEMPESSDVDTPVKTPSHGSEDVTRMSFSDDDEDMHVDFDMDIDTDGDSVRNEENDGDSDTNYSPAVPLTPDIQDVTEQDDDSSETKKTDGSPNKHAADEDLEETMDTDVSKTEKKNKLSAALAGMKEVKILIPKLDIEKLRAPVRCSQLSSVCNSVKLLKKDQPVHDDKKQSPKSSNPQRSTESNNKPSGAKAVQMTCSHCKKSMMMGQTAYQKKGFTDVFCSKNCLFEMFPINKPAMKTCHYCYKAITQPLDLIMAAVDIKGTMKDFCSVTCLASFKSNGVSTQTPQSACSMCAKSCTTTCELTLFETVHKFCSSSCMEDFRRDNVDNVCDNCSDTCKKKPLKLKLEDETKTICSDKCLDEFKEKTKMSHECTTCHVSRLISEMVHDRTDEDVVELFCTRTCVISYRQWSALTHKLRGEKNKKERGKQSNQTLNSEEGETTSGATGNEHDDSTVNQKNHAPPAADSDTPILITAKSFVVCCHCGTRMLKGQTVYKPRSSPEVFCSASCISEKHPHIKIVTKKCYNCLQVIMRPHNIILAPVDDSGTMKELCSNACLLSVNSKRNMAPKPPAGPRFQCRMCTRYSICKFSVTLDGVMRRFCSDPCIINYHKINNLPLFTCDVCSAVCLDDRLKLTMEDGSKTICSEECLVKFKEKIETPQMCPMCQTSHQMSDMVENKNDEGKLDFFCSNRCLMVHKAQSVTVSGKNGSTTVEDTDIKEDIKDIKEVKPSLLSLDCIKQEPIDEDFKPDLTSSISTENIKDEPNVPKEDLKIDSVFSLKEDSTSTAPPITQTDLPVSCSNCNRILLDGETVYQRKGHVDIFCSTPCLLKFYQMKKAKTSCHFCLQTITQPQGVLQAPVDSENTMKDFCSQTCLSSFNYKRNVSSKIPIKPLASQSQCSMCSRYCISKREIIQQDVIYKICSDPCYLRFCTMNNVSSCENCRSLCNTSVTLKIDDGSKKLCSAQCLAQFKQKINTPQPCAMCSTPHLMSGMVENKNSDDVVELFCTNSCVMASKIQAISAAGLPLNCDNCGKTTIPACHLAMSDASIRNFCTLTCAMAFKEKSQTQNSATNPTAASDKTQCDHLKPPEKLPCAQCQRVLKTTPKVVQKKGKIDFVCSLACSREFKRVNNIVGKCEYCKNERIIRDAKKVDGKDCYFCSDSCKRLFHTELEKEWGKYCRSCTYCLSISKTLVTAQYKGTEMKFCSEDCSSNFNSLFCHVAKCDACGCEGDLKQSLPLLGEVKHFCDLKCVLHFCNKKVQMANTVSSPPRSADTVESSLVITNVISLAGALARHPSASVSSAQTVFVSDIQTKVVGHASVQTAPKELKNKSMLCTPLVHNKGVSCTTQTVSKDAQTDNFVPKVIVVPLPLPVYVPLPLNMYSQYTPQPVGLPLPLPVPVFLPVTAHSSDTPVKSSTERVQSDPLEGELNLKSDETKEMQDEKNEREDEQRDRVVSKQGQRQEVDTPKEHTISCSDDLDKNHHTTLINQDSFSDISFSSLSGPHTVKTPPVSEVGMPSETVDKVHNTNKGRKLQELSEAPQDETSQRDLSKHHKLKSQCGIDAWKRWIQQRESQINPDLILSRAVTFNEDVLRCSVTELSDGLCSFITEVKQPDGESYSPDSLFYLCLSIQQYLFENDRMENIFSDLMYQKFSVQFTRILKGFKPSSGYVRSRVEEEFLWDCKQLGTYSPVVLLNTLLFFCCKYFGFTTVEQHRQLSFAHFRRCTKTNQDYTKTSFLRFYPPVSMNEAESDIDGVPAKRRKKDESSEDNILEMMENTENPLRCPVRLYEFYLSKCSESVKQRTDLFYLQPARSCVPNSPLWFSSTPLDDGTMEAMLVRTLTVRELQGGVRGGVDQQMSDDEEDSE